MLAAVAPAGDLTDVPLQFRAAATAFLGIDQDGRGDFDAVAVRKERAQIALLAPETLGSAIEAISSASPRSVPAGTSIVRVVAPFSSIVTIAMRSIVSLPVGKMREKRNLTKMWGSNV